MQATKITAGLLMMSLALARCQQKEAQPTQTAQQQSHVHRQSHSHSKMSAAEKKFMMVTSRTRKSRTVS
ncbi:hypothetical protein ERX35_004770 [Macrococcus equipercicus]|uniref:Lipoprotein n=1 Tax=Macrococcus equipercicus TaxID=69967 RepID=A0ABQ6RAI3_9STAP|nr:hypothetical protein [Macrococcus equipercicus]KAA1040309.1 hypothetical protein ERX35_004770 [Macrococcus equipercicus]